MPVKRKANVSWAGLPVFAQYFDVHEWDVAISNPMAVVTYVSDEEFEPEEEEETPEQPKEETGEQTVGNEAVNISFDQDFEQAPEVYIQGSEVQAANITPTGFTLIPLALITTAIVVKWIARENN